MPVTEIPASLARLLADADAITAARTNAQQRAWLASKESPYADSPDDALVTAAFAGWAVGTMDDLARELRQEIARNAALTAQQSVAHAKLYDYEARLSTGETIHEMELRAIREGSPAVQNGPYAYMTGPHADA